ncbi:MAG: hypothetical protein MUE40_02940 [Anaerolineae bacterium]|nr:hypothetical protein [Anaerolineae bacterium]
MRGYAAAGLLLFLLLAALPATAQQTTDAPVTLRASAGYDGCFREGAWLPVQVRVRNSGSSLSGRLTVRPETSGRVVSNAYSTPLDLPAGSEKEVFLYVLARSQPPEMVVELLDAEGVRVAQQTVSLRLVDPRDELHVVVTGPAAAGLPLNTVHAAERSACQARRTPASLPDQAAALEAVDTLWLVNADTAGLTQAQQTALEAWVLDGGHLVVMGGPGWQETAAGLPDLLPLRPQDSRSVTDVAALARLAGLPDALAGRTVVATGRVREDARVLAESPEGVPLLLRRAHGNGTVDYLALDATLAPLSDWPGSPALWRTLILTGYPRPFWTQNVPDLTAAATAVAILPGIDLLPPVSSMILFLLAYIVLIGPLNYLLLNRLNRRGFAWVTIPLCIVVFTGLAWTVGFNLRGSDVTLSRVNLIRTWPASELARVDSLVSLLAPRRGSYSLIAPAGYTLRVLPTLSQGGLLLTSAAQSTADIAQGVRFTAEDFAVDGGIFANFGLEGLQARPDIGGTLSLIHLADGTQALQGVLRNDSPNITLTGAVLLSRGAAYRLAGPFGPGDLVTLAAAEVPILAERAQAAPAPLELAHERLATLRDTREQRLAAATSINAILGDAPAGVAAADIQQRDRLTAVLSAFLADQFGSTAYGDHAYLAGWSSEARRDVALVPGDTNYINVETTLYLIQIAVQPAATAPEVPVTITPDRFTWSILERRNVEGAGPYDLTLLSDAEVVLRYTPLPAAVLSQVQELTIFLDRSSGYGGRVSLDVWDWQRRAWEALDNSVRQDSYTLSDPAPYLGPGNAVQLRLRLSIDFGSAWIRRLTVTQQGS